MAIGVETFKLLSLPEDWSAEGNFRPLGKLSAATQRNIEPVGAHFLAEARRVSFWFVCTDKATILMDSFPETTQAHLFRR